MSLFCKHKWEKVNEIKFESEFQQIRNANYKPDYYHSLTQKVVTDYMCSTCGKLKRFTTKSA